MMEVTLVLHGLLAARAQQTGPMRVPTDTTVADVLREAGLNGHDGLVLVMDGQQVQLTDNVSPGARITAFLRVAGG